MASDGVCNRDCGLDRSLQVGNFAEKCSKLLAPNTGDDLPLQTVYAPVGSRLMAGRLWVLQPAANGGWPPGKEPGNNDLSTHVQQEELAGKRQVLPHRKDGMLYLVTKPCNTLKTQAHQAALLAEEPRRCWIPRRTAEGTTRLVG
jgi:hypothetical protein